MNYRDWVMQALREEAMGLRTAPRTDVRISFPAAEPEGTEEEP